MGIDDADDVEKVEDYTLRTAMAWMHDHGNKSSMYLFSGDVCITKCISRKGQWKCKIISLGIWRLHVT